MEERVRMCTASDIGPVLDITGPEQERFYRGCRVIILRYLRKYTKKLEDYDDTVQEVLFRLWANRRNFRGESRLRTYVIGILRNVLSEMYKAKRKRSIVLATRREQLKESGNAIPTPEELYETGEILGELQEAIRALTPDQQFVIALAFSDCMPCSEAAAGSGCTAEALRSRLRRAREALVQKLSHIERPVRCVSALEVQEIFTQNKKKARPV